ncbi:S1 RNA-binding domain-containing protein [Rhizomonospora bruguierae]|uniref:S1 RNA-binding domain-containing protein n=1 Tax=Rhizomonospora bruguierae TaxID=1581705 RepID=UPI001BCE1B33|nr:S1 RNA-binding domain-containing protein [Micromonospora sp. NBRC 107566]
MEDPIRSRAAAAGLAEEVLDHARSVPLLVVCMAADRETPLIPPDLLDRAADGAALVRTVVTGEATWELKHRLPAGLDVYGDAVRIWWPAPEAGSGGHPLLLLDADRDPALVAEWVRAALDRRPRQERAAVVATADENAATLRLAGGGTVIVAREESNTHGLAADRVLRPGQPVRVLVLKEPAQGLPGQGSLLPFEPDVRRRLSEGYPAGTVLRCRVWRLHRLGAVVDVLPGLTGLVPVSELADEWVGHPDKRLAVGDLVDARLLDTDGQTVRLTLRGVGAGPAVAAALLPDGPPWLAPPTPAVELPDLAESDPAVLAWERTGRAATVSPGDPAEEFTELDRLEDAVRRAAYMHRRTEDLLGDTERRLVKLRAQAAELRHELEVDLIELHDRALRSVEQEYERVSGSSQQALDAARVEIHRLRGMLADAVREQDRLAEQARSAGEDARRSAEALRRANVEAKRQRTRARRLDAELAALVPESDRLRAAIRSSWLRQTSKADRARYPWREPVIGPDFAASLDNLEGVSRERVMQVCAEVVSGRAADRSGLQVHALRSADGGGSAQRTRHDGARAYRASLQVRTAAARRLHYWVLPDGRIELAKVGYHDDFTIR